MELIRLTECKREKAQDKYKREKLDWKKDSTTNGRRQKGRQEGSCIISV